MIDPPDDFEIMEGGAREQLSLVPDGCAQTCITSPPYYALRDYGVSGQIGQEDTLEEYVGRLVEVFREVRRVLANNGTLWLNLSDRFLNKQLLGVPWKVAFALQEDGWYLRSDIVWHKTNPTPESVKDRPTRAHEFVFLLAPSRRYFYDYEAVLEPCTTDEEENYPARAHVMGRGEQDSAAVRGSDRDKSGGFPPTKSSGNKERKYGEAADRPGSHLGRSIPWEGAMRNKRDVWRVATRPFPGAHFAVYPPELIQPCIQAGSREGDLVLDPFTGSGTTGVVCTELGRRFLGVDLQPNYVRMARRRIKNTNLSLFG